MSRRGRILVRVGMAVLGLALLVWTVNRLGPRDVLDLALRADPLWLAASVVPVFARYLIWSVKWCGMLQREGPVPFRSSQRMLMAGCFVNLTTPTAKLGGGVLRTLVLHRRFGWSLSTAFGWVLADQMTNVLGSMLLFGVLALSGGAVAASGAARVYVAIGGAALFGFILMVAARGWAWRTAQKPRLAGFLGRFTPARFRVAADGAAQAAWVRPVFRPLLRQSTWLDVFNSAASFAMLCASNAVVLRALGVDAALWIVAVAVGMGYFAGNGLGPWGGIGITEAAMAGVYLQLGLAGEVAAAGVLLHRASYYLVGLIWGGIALWRLGKPRGLERELELANQ